MITAAFLRKGAQDGTPPETVLVDELREEAAWLPALSLVAQDARAGVIGHVLCTRGRVGSEPALALAPLSVHPDHQRRGVGTALVHTVLGAADALDAPLVTVLGDPGYYSRFGFRPAGEYAITPPVAQWEPFFQVRPLAVYDSSTRGVFTYPKPFDRL